MNELLLTAVATLLGSSVISAIILGLFGRRKISAEATEIVTRAAGAQVERIASELQDVRSELQREREARATLERKVDRMERREGVLRDVLTVHVRWDWRAEQLLRSRFTAEELQAEEMFPPPPLSPPG